jgi:hypothetical protein
MSGGLFEAWTVQRHLEGLPVSILGLYQRFISLVEDCGPFTYSVTKTAIALKGSRRGFAGAKPKPASLDGFLDMRVQVRDPRFRRVSPYTKRLYVHQFRITELSHLDGDFVGWIQEAYAVGAGLHL